MSLVLAVTVHHIRTEQTNVRRSKVTHSQNPYSLNSANHDQVKDKQENIDKSSAKIDTFTVMEDLTSIDSAACLIYVITKC